MLMRLFLALVLGAAALPTLAAEPADIVTQRTRTVLEAITQNRAAYKAEPQKLRELVRRELDGVMDSTYAAQLVLARHARNASQQQVRDFAEALTESLLRRYADALLGVDPGTEVNIASSTPMRKGQLMRVASRIVRRAGEPVQVDYMFRNKDGQWRAFDVIVEGISYVQTYRNQFDEILRSRSLDQVIADLRSGRIQLEDTAADDKLPR